MSRPVGRRAAVVLPVGTTALALLLAAYGVVAGAADSLGNVVVGVGFGAVGALLVGRVPRNPVGWILLATALGQAASAALVSIGLDGSWVGRWAWAPGVWGVVAVLPHVFPSGPLPGRWWRVVAAASVTSVTLATVGYALPASDPVGTLIGLSETGVACSAVAGLASLVVRWRRGAGAERQQLKWLLLATVALLVAYAVGDVLPATASSVVFVVVPLLLPAAVAMAVLRHGLYEVDLILNRTLVYGALSLLVLAAYAGGVALFGRASGLEAGPVLATTVAVALLFDPLRRRLQRLVNRLTYGRRDEPLAVLRDVAGRLEAAGPPETVLPEVAATIAGSLRLPYVAFTVRLADAEVEAVAHGEPAGPVRELPLTWHDEPVGRMRFSARGPGESLTRADLRLLQDVTRHAGAAARSWQLAEELRRSAERLVTIRHAERERLRADLHDGLGPLLAGVELGLGGVERMLPTGHAARPVATRIGGQVGSAIAEVRRLIDELRPAALDDLGLVEALSDHAAVLEGGSGTAIVVDVAPGLPRLRAEVELAAYRISMEALTNVVHHAGAARSELRITTCGEALRLHVADDGHGMRGAPWGVGLTSMSRRVAALGGVLEVGDGDGGGTVLRVDLPLAPLPEGARP